MLITDRIWIVGIKILRVDIKEDVNQTCIVRENGCTKRRLNHSVVVETRKFPSMLVVINVSRMREPVTRGWKLRLLPRIFARNCFLKIIRQKWSILINYSPLIPLKISNHAPRMVRISVKIVIIREKKNIYISSMKV